MTASNVSLDPAPAPLDTPDPDPAPAALEAKAHAAVVADTAVVAGAKVNPGVEVENLTTRAKLSHVRNVVQVWRGRILRFLVPVALIVVWQLASSLGWADEFTLPPPSQIVAAYGELWTNHDLQEALPVSLQRAGIGLFFGVTIGLVLGLFAGLWKIGEEIFDAPLQMLRTIPFIAVVPLFITWFGIGEKPKLILIAAATVFPVYLNTYHGVRGVDKKLIEAGQMFGLRNWRLAARVILPTALPSALTGLRYAAGVSLLALVLAEQINAREGIGYLLNNANQNQRPDIVIAGILIYATLGILLDVVMRIIEHFALPWRPRVTIG